MLNPTLRFSTRAKDYAKYRPSYPVELIELLEDQCHLGPSATVADIGSGTGILTGLLLSSGAGVFAVEPNENMRKEAEAVLSGNLRFHSVPATAEATTLESQSIDLITAGQAFHWFDKEKAHLEFQRILKPGGQVALVWNKRQLNTPFLRDYESLLQKYGSEYPKIGHRTATDKELELFFGAKGCAKAIFANEQYYDFDGLKGRVISSSYMPQEGDPNYDSMLSELRALYAKYEEEDAVLFSYETVAYYGDLPRSD